MQLFIAVFYSHFNIVINIDAYVCVILGSLILFHDLKPAITNGIRNTWKVTDIVILWNRAILFNIAIGLRNFSCKKIQRWWTLNILHKLDLLLIWTSFSIAKIIILLTDLMMNKSRSNKPRAKIAILLYYLLTVNSIVFNPILIPGEVIFF